MRYSFLLIILVVLSISCSDNQTGEIFETDSGYKYEFIKKGKGQKSKLGEYAYFNAEVESLEGDLVFSSKTTGQPGVMQLVESSPEKPSPFSDVLLNANVGDSIHVYLGLQQGIQGSGYDSLIYKIGYYEQLTEEEYRDKIGKERAEREALAEKVKAQESVVAAKVSTWYDAYKKGEYDNEILSTPTGLRYYFENKSSGEFIPLGELANVHYYGILDSSGEMFDNSWKRGTEFSFPLGKERVIKGWDEGVSLLPKGSSAFLLIPSELGYGESGTGALIKPGSDLIFYIEVKE